MIGPANKIICVSMRRLGLIQIERIRLFTCQRQISFLTSFEGNQFLVKQINRSHRKWIDLRSWLNRASQISKAHFTPATTDCTLALLSNGTRTVAARSPGVGGAGRRRRPPGPARARQLKRARAGVWKTLNSIFKRDSTI